MNPLELRVLELEERLSKMEKIGSFTFYKKVQMLDGRNIQLGRTTGTKLGTEGGSAGQKLGFFNATPVIQQSALANIASGGGDNDGTARTRCDAIVTVLENLGLMST